MIFHPLTNIRRHPTEEWDVAFSQMDELYADFEALELSKLASSRIRAYRDAFTWLSSMMKGKNLKNGKDKTHLANAEKMLHAIVEFHQIRTIVEASRISANSESWRTQLKRLISGTPFQKNQAQQNSARDFQFESYLGAVCELSGYQVVFEEPDLMIRDNLIQFGLAAKRPKNPRKIETNYRKAARQIKHSGSPGLIALDLSMALYCDKCINTNELEGATAFVELAIDHFRESSQHWLQASYRDSQIFGVLITLHLPVLKFGHAVAAQLASATRWELILNCEPTDPRFQWGIDFASRCEQGLFGPRKPNEFE
ncbi:MAG: hypothetical protein ACKN9T_14630 [Candidatus Methylumidiphilus sp.]